MAITEGERPQTLSPQELGQRSFDVSKGLKSSLRINNSAFKRNPIDRVFSDPISKVVFNLGHLSYVLEVKNALLEVKKDKESKKPYSIHSRRVFISRFDGKNTSSVELRFSWYEDSSGNKEFNLGGIKTTIGKTEYEDTEEAYLRIPDALGRDFSPSPLSPI